MVGCCFVAIVKNESKCIRRCLESVKHIADYYIISDTGSTDNTIEIIKSAGEEFGMKGIVRQDEWVNYSHNRNIVMTAAYQLDCDYIIWNDADDYFINSDGDFPTQEDSKEMFEYLDKHQDTAMFGVTMQYCGIQYKRMCILRNNQLYIWKSPKHEYLTATVNDKKGFVHGIINRGSLEGAARKDPERQMKDTKLFLDYIHENGGPSKCSREVFYLAQDYSCFDKDSAILYYKMYLEIPDELTYIQEKYVACLRLYDYTKNLMYLEQAINYVPRRLEAYYELIRYYNSTKEFYKALEWANKAPELRKPHPDDLFSSHDIYQITFDLQYAVTLYWVGKYRSSYEINKKNLERNKNTNSKYVDLLKKNQEFCILPEHAGAFM